MEVINDWSKAIDDGYPIDTVYLDYRKAFDSVPHLRLLSKLESYGIKESLLRWIKNFLTGRIQRDVINGSKSSFSLVSSGIPQGSVLGPILFQIYVNDLPEELLSPSQLFADNTKLYRVIKSEEDNNLLQGDIDRLIEWSDVWQLPINTNKCKVMHIGKKMRSIPTS